MKRLVVVLAVLAIVILSGCIHIASRDNVDRTNQVNQGLTMKDVIEAGDSVTLYYKGTLEDGTVFDETSPGDPATFQVGVGGLIKGFDDGLLGMRTGESKHIVIPAVDAYGAVNPQAILTVPIQQLQDANVPILVGARINSSRGQGIITEVNTDSNTVKIDFNHPLAGKNLIFDVNIVKIEG
ncbi:MAG: peptidylprolyl isomerase [Candidatus Iainarchaeum archaeon]|uniref:Peptidyl-prolyl cis-trans isomerase n=1 Tax=Candidatus Iainarchaeum sp. TaxID=3101447 RepID=A0A7T9DJ48_9ARCH|nr:MAG: peptidylprolyl isomerase [Candidatus Diapherotrites archaeon]